MFNMRDSRGFNSKTLFFVYIAFITGTLAFIYTTYLSGHADLFAYGGFVTTTLIPWLGRELLNKKGGSKDVGES